MRILILILITNLLMATSSYSATEIKGIIRKDNISLLSAGAELMTNNNNSFPKQHYRINSLGIRRLENSLTFKSGLKIESNKYEFIDVLGSLDLIFYNKKTGDFKYKLSVKAKKLWDMSTYTSAYKPIPINSKLLFNTKHDPEFFIEGRSSFINNKLILNTVNADQSGFSLSFGTPEPNRLALTAVRDIPITIYSD